AALLSMGILDAFHAGTYAGPSFVWLHSCAQFIGGLLFIGIFLPTRLQPRGGLAIPVTAAAVAIGLGSISIVRPDLVPEMQRDGDFTTAARALNLLGGLAFLTAALRFSWGDWSDEDKNRKLFAGHCLLFGLTGIIFEQSHL